MEDVVPFHILVRIVSFLPFKDQVRSSLVSKQWKELWKETGVLDFDSTNFSQSAGRFTFADLVSWSVDQQRVPIRSFRIALSTLSSNVPLQDLLNRVYSTSSGEGNSHLREMEIDLKMETCLEFLYKFHHSPLIWHVFPDYHGLKRLSLKNIHYQPAAVLRALSNCRCLEDLCLDNISMTDCDLHISSAFASMLRNLTLQNICLCEEVIVDAPNLVSIHYNSSQKLTIIDSPKLSSLSYEGPREWFFQSAAPFSLAAEFLRLLGIDRWCLVPTSHMLADVAGVKFLRIHLSFIFMWMKLSLSSDNDARPQPHPTNPSFKNLEELVILLHPCWGREWLVGFCEFLKVINQNLKHLTLQTHKIFPHYFSGQLLWDFEGHCLRKMDPSQLGKPFKRFRKEKLDCLDGLACNLKTFKMSYVGVRENEVLFIKTLLNNNGGALESAQLMTTDEKKREKLISTLKKQVQPFLFERVKVVVSTEKDFFI